MYKTGIYSESSFPFGATQVKYHIRWSGILRKEWSALIAFETSFEAANESVAFWEQIRIP